MSTEIATNGVQYTDRYNSSVGYKCCTKVEHNIILTHNCSTIKPTTVEIPQTDANCHILMMHLYNNDTLVNLCNVSNIEIKFTCGNKVIIGDYRKLDIVNACKGLISYILDADTTSYVGENQVKVILTIGTGTVTFDGSYKVVPNVQTDTTTIVLPDTCRDPEYVYGPYCRHTLSYKNSSTTDSSDSDDDSGCGCDNCPCCPVYPDGADDITLRDLYFITMRHINDKSLHLNERRIDTLNSAFKTVETYQDLLKEISCSCGDNAIKNGRLYRVNNVNGEVKYYEWDAANIRFNETTFGSKGEQGRDADDIVWNETGYSGTVNYNVGNLTAGTDISNMTITQILAKMFGMGKVVPTPIIMGENAEYDYVQTIALSFPITNLVNELVANIDLEKITVTGDKEFTSNILFDDVSNMIVITLSSLLEDTTITINFAEGTVSQTGDTAYDYEPTTVNSEQKEITIKVN